MTKINEVALEGSLLNKLRIRLICWTDSKMQIAYRNKLIPTSIYNIFKKQNHTAYSVATGEEEMLKQLIEKHRRN